MMETLSSKNSKVPSSMYTMENSFAKASKLFGVDSPNLYLTRKYNYKEKKRRIFGPTNKVYGCVYVCYTYIVYICIHTCIFVCTHVCITHVCMYVCMYICMYAICMYACMNVCTHE